MVSEAVGTGSIPVGPTGEKYHKCREKFFPSLTSHSFPLDWGCRSDCSDHFSFVSEISHIQWGTFDGFSWIRCSGKGNFMSSPAVKQCSDHCLQRGTHCIVVDLEQCSGMDSTFMGMLAGLSMRLTKQVGGGRLEIAAASEKNVSSLEDLGLDALIEINPVGAIWSSRLAEIRNQLADWELPSMTPRERSHEVLEAHKILAAANEENAEKFESVVQLLQNEIAAKPT